MAQEIKSSQLQGPVQERQREFSNARDGFIEFTIRRSFQDLFDYEFDSDDEWEEPADGEDIDNSEGVGVKFANVFLNVSVASRLFLMKLRTQFSVVHPNGGLGIILKCRFYLWCFFVHLQSVAKHYVLTEKYDGPFHGSRKQEYQLTIL